MEKAIKTEPFKLKDLINFQEGSVVSREIVREKTGTVTLFAFDQGQGLSEHTAPFDATILCLDGNLEATVDGKSMIVSEGEMLIMPAHKPHSIKAIDPFKMLLIMIRV
jgi:quercetin dioxygenase-like cupin family protein